jgi:hypothetical protein
MRWTVVSLGATILTLQIADTVDAAALEPNRIDVEYAPAQFVSLWFASIQSLTTQPTGKLPRFPASVASV